MDNRIPLAYLERILFYQLFTVVFGADWILLLVYVFFHPIFARFTGKRWPSWQSGWYHLAVRLSTIYIVNVLPHTGLALRLFGLDVTFLKNRLSNTCEGAKEELGRRRGPVSWPCERDRIREWYTKAMTGSADLGTFFRLLTGQCVIICVVGLILFHLAYQYFRGSSTPSRSENGKTTHGEILEEQKRLEAQ